MNRSWKICLALLIALTVSISTLGAASDFTLGIFGNANMDDTIDEKDVAYVEEVIKGTNAATNLSDANYDGKIDEKDIDQIKDIIDGKEKKLTYVTILGEAKTIHKPIERILDMVGYPSEVLRTLNCLDKVIAISSGLGGFTSYPSRMTFLPEISTLPTVGSWNKPDFEAILSQNPDVIMSYMPQAESWMGEKALWEKNLPNIHILELSFVNPPTGNKWAERDENNDLIRFTRTLGYILDKEEEAKEFCDWYEGYFNLIKSRTDNLSEDEKPLVYYEKEKPYTTWHTTRILRMIDVAGGRNLIAEETGIAVTSPQVDPEWVIERNPDIVIKTPVSDIIGYHVDDPLPIKEVLNSVLNRSDFAATNAVKNDKVYIFPAEMSNGPQSIIAVAYFAKWFHPDLFKDIDPEAIHQEYLNRFQHFDYDLNERGVFMYPPIEIDGNFAGIPDKFKGCT